MKKLLSIVAVTVAATVWYAFPVFAATFDVSGDYRVRGYYIKDANYNNVDQNWLDARFRTDLVVKQGMTTGVVQVDFLGNNTMNDANNGILVLGNDRGHSYNLLGVRQAFLSIAFPRHNLIVGRYNLMLGNGLVLNNTTDLVATSFGVGPVDLFIAYMIAGENDAPAGSSIVTTDETGFVVNAMMKAASWDWGLFFVQDHDPFTDADNKLQIFGLTANGAAGPVKIVGEVDFFSGDENSSTGYEGTNVLVAGSLPVNGFDVNAAVLYASGQDSGAGADTNINSLQGHGDFRASNALIRNDFNNFDGVEDLGMVSGQNLGLQAIKLALMMHAIQFMGASHTPEVGLVFAQTTEDDTSGNSDMGTEIYVNTNCVYDKNLAANIGLAFVSAGDVLGDEDQTKVEASITYHF